MGGIRVVLRGAALAGVLVPAVACGSGGGADVPAGDSGTIGRQVTSLAKTVVYMTNVVGKLTDGDPRAGSALDASCDEDDANSPVRQRLETWSLYGVDNGTLGTAMANLAQNLPLHGWKVVKNGPDSSSNRNQEIQAVHVATKTRLDATWRSHTPLILFSVSSGCFRDSAAPEDE